MKSHPKNFAKTIGKEVPLFFAIVASLYNTKLEIPSVILRENQHENVANAKRKLK